MAFTLLSKTNPKIMKGEKKGYLTFILHLAPGSLSGRNVCPKATAGCLAACLNTAGRGGIMRAGETSNTIQRARLRRTMAFHNDRAGFMADLVADIAKAVRKAERAGFIPVFRLNGTSDLAFEKFPVMRDGVAYLNIFAAFPDVQFYDYTKILGRRIAHIPNYVVTFSRADGNERDVLAAIGEGLNIAVVFSGTAQPATFLGLPVFNGDESDLRFLDPRGHVVGLYAKGKAKRDTSGFVVQLAA